MYKAPVYHLCYECRTLKCTKVTCQAPKCREECLDKLQARPFFNYQYDFCAGCRNFLNLWLRHALRPLTSRLGRRLRIEGR